MDASSPWWLSLFVEKEGRGTQRDVGREGAGINDIGEGGGSGDDTD